MQYFKKNRKNILMFFFLSLFLVQSCDDKKTQQFGGINLTISKKVISEEVEDDIDIEINFTQDDIELFQLKEKESKVKLNKNLIFNNFKIKKIDDIKPNELSINSSENQIADVDAIRVTLNNEQPTTVPIINGSASYSRDGLSVGTIPIKVDLFGDGTNKYSQTKSVAIIANQNSSALFNSFSVVNQQIAITNSNFSNTVVQGEQISFDWTNSHAERSVQISVIQNNDNNVIQVLEANYIGSSYALNTNNSNTANNIGFKVSSNIASNTSSSICCFDLVANAPQANDISSSVNEDSSVTIQLDASSPGGESVTYSIVSSPSNGSLGSISGSNVTYTPNQDFNGSDSFTYKANNGSQDSNTATVSITVNNVNDAPVVENLTTSTAYQQSVSIELNGSDIDGDNLTYFVNANPSNGTIAFSGSSTITYNPNSGFSGSDSFNYGANDGSLDSNIATVSITVEEDDSVEVTYPNGGQEFIIGQTYTLLWNNSFSNTGVELHKDGNKVLDINGDVGSATSLSWTVPSGLTTGQGYVIRVYDAGAGNKFDESDNPFTISGSSSNPTYSETNKSSILFGEDSFIELTEIDAELGKNNSSMTISLWFKAAHDPNRDVLIHGSGSSAEFGRLGFTVTGGFGKAYLRSPAINLELAGTTDFTNDRNWNHMAYVFSTTQSGDSFVRFYVNGVLENSSSFGNGKSFNAFDRKWEIGHYTAASSSDEDFQGHIDDVAVWNVALTDSELATIYNSGNLTLAHKVRADDLRAYYDFEDSSVDDKTGRGKNPVSTQNITIVNDVPGNTAPTVEDISISTSFEQSVSINLLGSDSNNDDLTYFVDSNPSHGTVAFNGSSTIIYTPNSDFSGNDSFTYYVNDGVVDSNIATVSIVTSKVNITYPVGGESLTIGEQYQLTWDGGFTNTGIELWNGEQKIVDINGDVGTANSFDWTIPSSISAGDGFFVKIYDASSGTDFVDSNNFSIVSNNAPTTENVSVSIDENRIMDRKIGITLDGNDVDGDNLTYSLVTTPLNGTQSINGNILTYNANQDWNGVETFTYKANDGELDSNISTITITVNPVNDNPVVTVGDPFAENNKSGLFNGNARVNIGTRGDLSGQDFVSIQAWVAPNTSSQEAAATVLAKGTNINNSYRQYGMYLNEDSGQLAWSWSISTETGETSIYSSNVAEISEWTHLVGTYDGSVTSLYVNGVLSSSSAHSGNINAGNSTDKPLLIGHLTGGGQYYFKGNIDEVAIWDLSLSDSQVNELYNAGLGMNALNLASSDLHAYWNFENDFQDQSGNNRHGTGESVTFDDNIPTGLFPENFTTNEDAPLNIDISPYVSDVDNDDLAISFPSNASNGSLTANNLIVTYTPNLNFNGNDSFSWSVSDGTVNTGAVNTNIVVSSVNDAPVTTNQSATAVTNQALDITLTATDIENDSVTFSIVSDVSNGSTSLNGAIVTYTPSSNFSGSDSFTFKANDGTDDSNVSTVAITVNNRSTKSVEISSPSSVSGNSYQVYPLNFDVNGEVVHISATVSLNGDSSTHLRYMNLLLTSPNQSRVLLMGGDQLSTECSQAGQCIDSNSGTLTSTSFNSDATTFIYDGSAPFIGSFKPNESLNTFVDEEINGEWQLHIINSNSDNIDVSNIKLDITYDADTGGTTYTEENNFVFSTSDQTGLTVSGNSTGILDIPVSLPTGKGIKDLDFELSLNGDSSTHLRYISVTVDIGNSNNAMLVFRGDQISGSGATFGYNQGSMFKARFDDESTNGYTNSLMHAQRVEADSNSAGLDTFDGQAPTSFRIYI